MGGVPHTQTEESQSWRVWCIVELAPSRPTRRFLRHLPAQLCAGSFIALAAGQATFGPLRQPKASHGLTLMPYAIARRNKMRLWQRDRRADWTASARHGYLTCRPELQLESSDAESDRDSVQCVARMRGSAARLHWASAAGASGRDPKEPFSWHVTMRLVWRQSPRERSGYGTHGTAPQVRSLCVGKSLVYNGRWLFAAHLQLKSAAHEA